jgi:hypothetical protein
MDESSPILVREENGILRMAWDNRQVRKDKFILPERERGELNASLSSAPVANAPGSETFNQT